MTAVYTRNPWLDRLMHGAVYGVVVLMPLSVLFPLFEPLGRSAIPLYVTPGIELADIPTSLLLILAVIDRWLGRRHAESVPRRSRVFARLVTGLAALGLASSFTALTPSLAVYTAIRWMLAAAVLWAIVRTRMPAQRIVYVLATSLCVHAVIALFQGWYAGPLGLPGELTLRPDQSSAPIVQLDDKVWLRSFGLTFHPNVLGGYFAVALTLLLPLLSSRPARLLWCALTVGLATTLSRSAGLAFLLVLVPVGWSLWRVQPATRAGLRRTAVVFGCVALVAIGVLWQPIGVRLDPFLVQLGLARGEPVLAEKRSLVGRQEMNALAVEIISQHPLLGIGAGNFPIAMERAKTQIRPQFVHNVPLLLAAEVGIGGGIIWLAITVCATALVVRRTPDPFVIAAVGAWWVLAIVGLFDCYPWSLNAGRLLTVTVLSILAAGAPRAANERK